VRTIGAAVSSLVLQQFDIDCQLRLRTILEVMRSLKPAFAWSAFLFQSDESAEPAVAVGARSLRIRLNMRAVSSLFSLLNITCGTEFLILILVVELVLILVALFAWLVLRQQHALMMILPLTFIPLFLGGLRSLITLSTAVDLLRDADSNSAEMPDGVLLLAMSAAPMLFGIVATIPAFLIVTVGRVWMSFLANRKPKAHKAIIDGGSHGSSRNEDHLASDTDNYLAELTRSRR